LEIGRFNAIEAAHVDVDLVWMGARAVVRVNPALPTEVVLRRVGPKGVRRERVASAEQLEVAFRHDEMQESFFHADAAVALDGLAGTQRDAISDGAAVTASLDDARG
jgi:hypothetical protein